MAQQDNNNPFIASDQLGAKLKAEKEAREALAKRDEQAKKDALDAQKRHEEDKRRGMI